jgi:GNAT superfamily N-acetyltransferase
MRVEPLTGEYMAALARLFEAASSPCFCRYWHFTGNKNEWLDRCAHRPEENRAELEAALAAGDPSARGLVAIEDDGTVVGWMKLTPRAAVAKLRALPVYRALDLGPEDTTLSVGCFLIDPSARRRGVARALLGAAEAIGRASGARAVEGYPRRAAEPLHDEEAWQGPERVFVELGFEAVHDLAPYPVYRKVLT